MRKDRINRLINITKTTCNRTNRTYSLWLLLTNHIKFLTIDELFSFLPFIWETDVLNNKFFGIRQQLEKEIKERQDSKTILMLLDLLKNDNPYLRFFGADLLNYFKDEKIIEPTLIYLKNTTDDFMTKRLAICALGNYKDDKVNQYLKEEFERNKTNQDTFFRNNYLTTIEWIINKNN